MTTTTHGATPEVVLQLTGSGSTLTVLGDKPQPINATTVDDARAAGLAYVLERAAGRGQAIRFDAHDPDGDWQLLAHPDGQITEYHPGQNPGPARSGHTPAPTAPPAAATAGSAPVNGLETAGQQLAGPQPPEARIVHRVDHMTVHVDASLSTDLDGGLVEFLWDFGDGSSGNGTEASHTYADGGQYSVTLKVVSRSGLTSDASLELDIRTVDPTKLTDEERSEILGQPASWGFRGWSNRNFPGTRQPSARECSYRIRAAEETKRREHRKALVNSNVNRTQGYCAFVVIQSEKGGVGKSTTSALVAYFISKLRQEAVLLVDLNPDKTNLHAKLGVHPTHSLLDLVVAKDSIPARRQAKEFCTKVPGMNVYLLSNEVDAETREQTRRDNVLTMRDIVRPFFPIGVLDNGTGSRHPAMEGAISIGHSTLLVMENTRDFDAFVHSTLKRLATSDNPDLRKRVVIVVNTRVQPPVAPAPLPRSAEPDVVERHRRMVKAYEDALKGYINPQELVEKYRGIVRATVVIPYDQALANSGVINFDALLPETEEAGEELARLAMEDLSEEARHDATSADR